MTPTVVFRGKAACYRRGTMLHGDLPETCAFRSNPAKINRPFSRSRPVAKTSERHGQRQPGLQAVARLIEIPAARHFARRRSPRSPTLRTTRFVPCGRGAVNKKTLISSCDLQRHPCAFSTDRPAGPGLSTSWLTRHHTPSASPPARSRQLQAPAGAARRGSFADAYGRERVLIGAGTSPPGRTAARRRRALGDDARRPGQARDGAAKTDHQVSTARPGRWRPPPAPIDQGR